MIRIFLLKSIDKLGQKGTIVEVKEGYALNFIIPKGIGRRATAKDEEVAEKKSASLEARKAKKAKVLASAKTILVQKFKNKPLMFASKSARGGKLYKSIDENDIIGSLIKIAPELKLFERGELELKLPQKLSYIGRYVADLLIKVDGDSIEIPFNIDIVSDSGTTRKSRD